MPEPAAKPADWKALSRQRARRREAVGVLRVAEATVGYCVRQLSDGLDPEQARTVAIDAAAELEAVAAVLYRLARLRPADRARLSRLLVASGMTRREAAVRLGVSERTVRYYLHGRPGPGGG